MFNNRGTSLVVAQLLDPSQQEARQRVQKTHIQLCPSNDPSNMSAIMTKQAIALAPRWTEGSFGLMIC
jgi:hypothetical protein